MSASAVVPRGDLVFLCCVSGETGRHDAIASIIEATGIRADMAVLNGTGNRVSLGNRGRVDITVTVYGSPCHSSRPTEGCNAITGAIELIRRMTEGLRLPPPHPQLGPAGLTVNRIRSLPDTTHTVQARCDIGIDRRLLPGENPDAAVADIAAIAKTVDGARDPASGNAWRVEVAQGPMMHPSLVAKDSAVVRALDRASRTALGAAPEIHFATTAFDQGFLNHIGIEACTYGPGEADFAHTDLDMASVDRTRDAAKVYATLMMQYLA
jgi:acetylornithine deacetylase/succinyl-diaminopimelate desuccinylase-like protein